MFGMEQEAERRREVLAGSMGAGHRTAALDRSEARWWHGLADAGWRRRPAGARNAHDLPQPCDEILATTPALRG